MVVCCACSKTPDGTSQTHEESGSGVGIPVIKESYTLEEIHEISETMAYPRLEIKEGKNSLGEKAELPEICYRSKKGLQVTENMLEDALDLGIGYCFINFYFNELLSKEPTKYEYTYNDHTYYFTESAVEERDRIISRMALEGVKVISAVVCSWTDDFPELRYPDIEFDQRTRYCAFNVTTDEGRNTIAAVMSFLLERYDGEDKGYVDSWIIGNEVNDNIEYNYIGFCEGERFVSEYYKQFKYFYNLIREYDSECNVYIPLEPRWNTPNTTWDYGGKWFLEYFHECELEDQQMDWGLAYHPYQFPLSDADILDDGDEPTIDWDDIPTEGGEVTMDPSSPIVSMKNIHVLTDYLSHNLLTESGKVRSIICSEVGYTSFSNLVGNNESKQAANLAYAFYKAQMDPYIEAFIIRCQLDVSEGSPYFQFGLREDAEGRYLDPKMAFDVFKYMDTTESLIHTDEYLPVLGLKNWGDRIDGFDSEVFGKLRNISRGDILRLADDKNVEAKYLTACGAYEDCGYDDLMYRGYIIDSSEPLDPDIAGEYDLVGFNLKLRSGTPKGEMKLKIRLKSGNECYEAEGSIIPSEEETVFVDISDWDHSSGIETVELLINSADDERKYPAEYNVKGVLIKHSDEITSENVSIVKKPKKDVKDLEYTDPEDLHYTGQHQRPEIIVKDGDVILEEDKDYCISYANDRFPGTAWAVIQGMGDYCGTQVLEYEIRSEWGDVFDPVYYIENNEDVAETCGDDALKAEEHFITYGMAQARQGSAEFSPYYYMENYSDLKKEYGDEVICYYLHYIKVGKEENREGSKLINPAVYDSVDYTPVYDPAYYIQAHMDEFNALKKNEARLLRYYVEYGMAAGERGSAEFDVEQYRRAHPELEESFGDDLKAYYMYYIEKGYPAGESGTPEEEPVWDASEPLVYHGKDYSDIFDPVYYSDKYEDVADLKDDPESLIRHFAMFGMREGRQGNREFDPRVYFARYKALRDKYGNVIEAVYDHYITYGKERGL